MEEVKEDADAKEKKDSKLVDVLKQKKYENLGIWVESNIYFKNFKRIDI